MQDFAVQSGKVLRFMHESIRLPLSLGTDHFGSLPIPTHPLVSHFAEDSGLVLVSGLEQDLA